jgi:hypothetical protein
MDLFCCLPRPDGWSFAGTNPLQVHHPRRGAGGSGQSPVPSDKFVWCGGGWGQHAPRYSTSDANGKPTERPCAGPLLSCPEAPGAPMSQCTLSSGSSAVGLESPWLRRVGPCPQHSGATHASCGCLENRRFPHQQRGAGGRRGYVAAVECCQL